ncbi:Protein kinase, putative, partial [Hondaea fermentalgiana]
LAKNDIGDKGATALANALASYETLQTLNLGGNKIGDEGTTALANALASYESLQTLNLGGNNIGDEGAMALANALANNESLHTLHLGGNNIGDEGAMALANALANNASLHTLDFDFDNSAIEDALTRNRTLYEQSQTPLMQACKNEDISEAEKLVVSGTRIDARDTLVQTALVYVCKARDEDIALLLAKLLFRHSVGLSSESLGIRKAIKDASSKHYTKLSGFLSFIHSLPLAQLQTNALRMMVVNLFDQGVQTLEEFRRLTPARLEVMGISSARDRFALLLAFADPHRTLDLKVSDATDQTSKLGALATQVSLVRTERGEEKVSLHPRLHQVFADQLSRKNPMASFADFERQQAILREKSHELTMLQEAVKTDSEKVPERDEARRDLVAGIRKALSGGVEGQLEKLQADPVTKAAVDSCHSLWKEISNDPVDVDDAVARVTFEQVQEATQTAVEALKAWETRHDTSAARKHTEAAIDALDESTKRLGIQPTYFMTLRHPERTNELAKELETVQQAFEAELRTLASVDPMADAPMEEIRRSLASTISFYTSSVTNEVSRLQTAANDLSTSLSKHVPGLAAPNTSHLAELITSISQRKRKRERLEHDLKYAREDADNGDAQAQADIPGLEQKLAQIGSVYKLDSELRKERARVLRHAEEHYPELLCDQEWIKRLGIKVSVPQELSSLGLWLTNVKIEDFSELRDLAPNSGKNVLHVRDPNGREFVLKSFHLAKEKWSSRFYRQVTALAQMQSAYVVRIKGVFMQDAQHGCILMPYYEGGDLAAWIRDNPHADVVARRRIATGLLSGLHDLHSQGFVHCDVKPENVFLAPGLSPVLGDFDGVQMHNVIMTQPLQATIRYMSPELRHGNVDKVESAVDMYSVGVVLAELFQDAEISDATQSLISSLQSTDPAQRPSALEALRHEAFQIEPMKRVSCAICLDVYPINEGVSCTDGHFTCESCLSRSVRAATEAQSHVKVLRDGSMRCVAPDCDLVILGRSIAAAVP